MLSVATMAVLTALLPAELPQEPSAAVTYQDLLRAVSDLEALWRAPAAGERCVQFSSYDRKSDAGPADPEAWLANGDCGQYLRTVARNGRTEYVMVDAPGPGAVVRIWSANPSGNLYFYVDGEAEPRWTVDFAALLSGRVEGIGEPWCGVRSRGANCHLPFPFREHLEIASDKNDFYYQVNVRSFADGTPVAESFDPSWLSTRRAAIDAAGARIAPGGGPIELGAADVHVRAAAGVRRNGAGPGGTLWARRLDGPGILRGLRLRVMPSGADGVGQGPALMRIVRLVVRCDGETTVDVPVSDFFGSAPRARPFGGLAIGVRNDAFGYCDFPMPCAESLEVALVAEAALPCNLRIDAELGFAKGPITADALRFRASWNIDKDRRTRPMGDHLVLDASGGGGRYVGTTLVVRNPTKAWWGEGDEKITVDGEGFPSTFGTGTEDYFGYAWCCPERFDHPLHAQPQADGPANFGYACNVRLHVADQVPFLQRLRFDLELWHWQDVVVDYATVAYWYGAKGATAGLPAMPDVAARLPVDMQPPVAFVAAGVLEGEDLALLERTGGRTEKQDLSGFTDARWSRDAHLWWMDGEVGDRLVLGVPVPEAGVYRVQAALTTARDYAIVKFRIAGQDLGEPRDLYTPDVKSTGLVELGSAKLDPGTARFEVEVVGHNEKAVPRRMFGLDYLKLVKVE